MGAGRVGGLGMAALGGGLRLWPRSPLGGKYCPGCPAGSGKAAALGSAAHRVLGVRLGTGRSEPPVDGVAGVPEDEALELVLAGVSPNLAATSCMAEK